MFGLENAQSLAGDRRDRRPVLGVVGAARRRFPGARLIGVVVVQSVLILILFALPASRLALDGATAVGACAGVQHPGRA